MKRAFTLGALMVAGAALVIAQAPNFVLTPQIKASTIDLLLRAMGETYAYPDVAKKADSTLRANLESHEYDSVADGKAFAELLTKHLNGVCKDAHLRVYFSTEVLPPRRQADQPSADEIKQQKEFTRYANAGFAKIERLNGNVGYVSFRNFMDVEAARRPIKAAMEFLQDTQSLIVDIRQNGGGSPETVQLLCSYLFDDKPVHLNDLVDRSGKHKEYWTLKKVDGPRYLDKDVYVLVSKRTASAAEEFSYNLKNLKRATIVGEPTWGGANPGDMVRLNDHFSAFLPTAHAENPITKANWEGTGVIPDVPSDPDKAFDAAYGMALKKQIAATVDAQRKQMLQQVLSDLQNAGKQKN